MFLSLEVFERSELFWKNKLKDKLDKYNLSYKEVQNTEYLEENYIIEGNLFSEINKLCKNNDLAIYIFLVSNYYILLNKYLSLKSPYIISPIFNSKNGEYNKSVVLNIDIFEQHTFREILNNTKDSIIEAYKNEHFPIEKILDCLKVEKHDVFNHFILLKNIHSTYSWGQIEENNYEFVVELTKNTDNIEVGFRYKTSVFEKDFIDQYFQHYLRIIQQFIKDNSVKVLEFSLYENVEKKELSTSMGNNSYQTVTKSIHELFEEQVKKKPQNIAVRSTIDIKNIYDNLKPESFSVSITYAELDFKSTQLAVFLNNNGVGRESIVALATDHPIEIAIGIFGILKSGASFIPIDCKYKDSIISNILWDSSVTTIVCNSNLIQRLNNLNNKINIVHFNEPSLISIQQLDYKLNSYSNDLAYVIYTSGTTGMPKGVLVEHKGVVNYSLWRINTYQLKDNDNALQLLSYNFDGFYSNFFSTLLSGGTLTMIPSDRRSDIDYISEVFKKQKITNLSVVPSIFQIIVNYVNKDYLKNLRFVVLAGESSTKELLTKTKETIPGLKLYNEYGPTEASIASTCNTNLEQDFPNDIGKPIDNIKLFIFNNDLEEIPRGMVGELHIGGMGLARGYLNRVEHTHEKFIKPNDNNLLYKSGDLARLTFDNSLQYIGRVDEQIKINGIRIEIGEIKNAVIKFASVNEVVIILVEMDDTGNKNLVCFFTAETDIDTEELKKHLSDKLPEYMIPAYFHQLEKIPLTKNGKTDVKSLVLFVKENQSDIIKPSTKYEILLADSWAKVLNLKDREFDIHKSFFDLGGHSLSATVFVSDFLKSHNINISLVDFFKSPTIYALSKLIEDGDGHAYTPIVKAEKREYYPLSSAQKRLYTLQSNNRDSTAYNIFSIIPVANDLDKKEVEYIFNKLIEYHSIIRTSFCIIDHIPVQIIHSKAQISTGYEEIKDTDLDKTIANFIKPFDLSQSIHLRTKLVRTHSDKQFLLIDMHHIISDFVSKEIIISDISKLISRKSIVNNGISYHDYSIWHNSKEQQKNLERQKEYWLNKFLDVPPLLNLNTDFERKGHGGSEAEMIDFQLDRIVSSRIKGNAKENDVTSFIFFLSIINIFLYKLTGNNKIVIGTPLSGRNHPDIMKTVGMFSNTLPIISEIDDNKTFRTFLNQCKKVVMDLFENQDFQFDELVDLIQWKHEPGRNPVFDVFFNYLVEKDAGQSIQDELKIAERRSAKFDLNISVLESDKIFNISIEYNTQLYKKESINLYMKYLKSIIEMILETSDIDISDINLLSKQDRDIILNQDFLKREHNYEL